MYLKAINKFVLIASATCIVIGMQGAAAFSAEEQAEKKLKFTEKMAAILFQEPKDAFVYKREGRNDPFVPFVEERVVAKEVLVEELTGMRKFEPGQLSVVAIVSRAGNTFAMVQDSNNQGYIIRE
ncbi:MAG: pilus assembly protein PilP, partial [Desulfobulbaceae bacterium]|nr:pilus assembly protein PilP [Desulfobulbaceae bacterium]